MNSTEDVAHRKAVAARNCTVEGVRQVTDGARHLISAGCTRAEELKASLKAFGLHLSERSQGLDSFSVREPGLITLHLYFDAPYTNAVDKIILRIGLFRDKSALDDRDFEKIELIELTPKFDREFKVFWQDAAHTFSSGDAILDFAFDRFGELLEKQFKKDNG